MCERKCSRPFNLCWTKFYSVRPEQISWTFIENYRTLLIDFFSVLYCSLHRRLLKTTPSHDIGPVIDYKTLNIEQLLLFSFLNLWTGWLGHSGNDGNDGTDDDDDGGDENGDDDDDGNDGAYYLKVFLKTNIDYHPISRAQWECQNENFETGHLFSIVKLNFNVGLFSCIFWFEAIFISKSAIFCRSLFTREKGPK